MASVVAAGYTGAGGTLGPAFVFGRIAGRVVAQEVADMAAARLAGRD